MKTRRTLHNIDGILLLDKPVNMTANTALQKVKRLYSAKKAGHTGSLDPLATGMLPICFGEATKFSQYLLNANKSYTVIAQLGIKTTTADAEGEIVSQRPVKEFAEAELLAVLEKFKGEISQVPSMYSALKHQGRPLYELARQGITIEREARRVKIYELNLLDRTKDTLNLAVSCSKGTYIRTLIEDIGEALGCGAHAVNLRRSTAGPYQEQQMITLPALEKLAEAGDVSSLHSCLLPVGSAVEDWIPVSISEAALYYLRRGQPIIIPRAPTSGWVRFNLHNGMFIGIGEILDDGRVAPRRLIETKI